MIKRSHCQYREKPCDVKFQKEEKNEKEKKRKGKKIAQVSFQMGACALFVPICILFIVLLCYLPTYVF